MDGSHPNTPRTPHSVSTVKSEVIHNEIFIDIQFCQQAKCGVLNNNWNQFFDGKFVDLFIDMETD